MDGWLLLFLLGFGATAASSIWPRNPMYKYPIRDDQ